MRFLPDEYLRRQTSFVSSLPLITACLSFSFLGKDLKDFYGHIPVMIRELLYRLNDENADVLKATNLAFTALSNYVPSEELVNNVEFMRNLIASIVSDARRRKGGVGDGEFLLPGFNIPKGMIYECNMIVTPLQSAHFFLLGLSI